MRHIFFFIVLSFFCDMKTATAQEEIDGRWVDDNLEWVVLNENIRTDGTLRLCIAQIKEKRCVENVFTAYEILVYNAQGEEIWSGLWTGQKMAIRFRQPLPTAHKMEIKATKDFVINWMTGTKIHQTKPMSLTYLFP